MDKEVFKWIKTTPDHIKPLKVKWVYARKDDGKWKARLCVRGDLQSEADYEETFSPVVRHTTKRAFIAKAAKKKWKLHHVDVKTAFLNAKLLKYVFLGA